MFHFIDHKIYIHIIFIFSYTLLTTLLYPMCLMSDCVAFLTKALVFKPKHSMYAHPYKTFKCCTCHFSRFILFEFSFYFIFYSLYNYLLGRNINSYACSRGIKLEQESFSNNWRIVWAHFYHFSRSSTQYAVSTTKSD